MKHLTRELYLSGHIRPNPKMCAVLYNKVEIDGWKEPGPERSTTHYKTSMDEFKDAHVNHHLTQNNEFVAVFYFPKSKPSDMTWGFFFFSFGWTVAG